MSAIKSIKDLKRGKYYLLEDEERRFDLPPSPELIRIEKILGKKTYYRVVASRVLPAPKVTYRFPKDDEENNEWFDDYLKCLVEIPKSKLKQTLLKLKIKHPEFAYRIEDFPCLMK